MEWTNILGIVAGICTTVSVLPQLIKAWKTKQVKDVSVRMFSILVMGLVLWVVYGIIRNDMPIIAANGTSLALNSTMIYLMVRYRKKK